MKVKEGEAMRGSSWGGKKKDEWGLQTPFPDRMLEAVRLREKKFVCLDLPLT